MIAVMSLTSLPTGCALEAPTRWLRGGVGSALSILGANRKPSKRDFNPENTRDNCTGKRKHMMCRSDWKDAVAGGSRGYDFFRHL